MHVVGEDKALVVRNTILHYPNKKDLLVISIVLVKQNPHNLAISKLDNLVEEQIEAIGLA